jgi:hypothetical protein
MKRRYLALDIETVKLVPADASDWRLYRPLGISCAATLATGQEGSEVWHGGRNHQRPTNRMNRDELCKLVVYLERLVKNGYTIVTWNGAGFDFDVLAEESGLAKTCKRLARSHVDMMFHVFCQLGYGISLGAVAKGMGLVGKTGGLTGNDAPRLWAERKRNQVFRYVAQDAQTTLALAERCESERWLRWVTRSGRKRQMALPKGWLSVGSAQKLPEPITFWMTAPWSRQKFTAWLQ